MFAHECVNAVGQQNWLASADQIPSQSLAYPENNQWLLLPIFHEEFEVDQFRLRMVDCDVKVPCIKQVTHLIVNEPSQLPGIQRTANGPTYLIDCSQLGHASLGLFEQTSVLNSHG